MRAFGRFITWATLSAGPAFIHSAPLQAQSLDAFRTPPAQLATLPQPALDEFGQRLIGELYTVKSRVGSPTGQIGGAPHQTDRNAVRDVKALYDGDALIQSARRNFGLTRATYKPSDIDEFHISDMRLNRGEGDVLVASYNIRLPNRVSFGANALLSGETQPQLLVLRWNERRKQWMIVSEADFDTPKAALCGSPPGERLASSRFRREDARLAVRNLHRFQVASFAGAEKSVQARGFTYVIASGARKAEDGPVRARLRERTKPLNVEAIRSRDLLAVRFDTSSKLDLDGAPLDETLKPRLITMSRGPDGQWRLLAIAIFSTTAQLAADAKCVQPTAQ